VSPDATRATRATREGGGRARGPPSYAAIYGREKFAFSRARGFSHITRLMREFPLRGPLSAKKCRARAIAHSHEYIVAIGLYGFFFRTHPIHLARPQTAQPRDRRSMSPEPPLAGPPPHRPFFSLPGAFFSGARHPRARRSALSSSARQFAGVRAGPCPRALKASSNFDKLFICFLSTGRGEPPAATVPPAADLRGCYWEGAGGGGGRRFY
jgi:hypothetical protein